MSVRERARDHQKGGISFLIETDACRLVARPCSAAAQQCQVKLAAVNKRTLRPGGFIRDNRPHLSKLTALHTSTLDFQTHTCMVDTLHSPLFQIMTPSEKSHQVQRGGCIHVCVCEWVFVSACVPWLSLICLWGRVWCYRATSANTTPTTKHHSQVSSSTLQQACCLFQ